MSEDPTKTAAANATKARRVGAIALVVGLAALTAQATETDVVHDIQRYCTACWRNARLDPGLWDDCTQEVCVRLLGKARAGQLDLNLVLALESSERREMIRAIDMVRKRVQRTKRFAQFDDQGMPGPDIDARDRERRELGELLENARRAVLSDRQDKIVEMWTGGFTVPEISDALGMTLARVSDEKYKALRKLERHLAGDLVLG